MSHISRVLGPVWLVPPLRDRAARRPSQETAPTGLDPRGCGRQQVLRTLAEGGCWNEWMSRRRWERMMMQEKMGRKAREEGLHHRQQASRLPPRAPHPQPLRPPARPHGPPLQPRVSPFRLPLCQVPPDPPCHAELCFLSWFQSWGLSPDEHYYVTWFISWSPCCECAAKVAQFLEENRNVSLSLSAARLYYFWKSESREGLRRLSDLGAQVGIMSFQDFQHCWNNFVHNLGMPFQPWKKLHKNYQRLVTELKQILREEPATYGSPQAQGKVRIGSTAAGLRHSHSHTRSEAHLRPNHSSRQHRILNPPREARARTCVLVDASWICYR